MASRQAADTTTLGAGLAATTGLATAAVASVCVAAGAAVASASRSAFATVVVAASRLTRVPCACGVARLPAFADRVTRASAAIAPRMIDLVRTIRPPCGVVRLLQRWRSSSLTAGERAFGVLGPLAQFAGPENRDQPALLPDVAPDRESVQRAVHVFAAGRDHRGERTLGEPHVDPDAVRRAATVGLAQVEKLARNAAGDVEEGDLGQALIDLLDVAGQRLHQVTAHHRMPIEKREQGFLGHAHAFGQLHRLRIRRPSRVARE